MSEANEFEGYVIKVVEYPEPLYGAKFGASVELAEEPNLVNQIVFMPNPLWSAYADTAERAVSQVRENVARWQKSQEELKNRFRIKTAAVLVHEEAL